jgi:hypothetical protein
MNPAPFVWYLEQASLLVKRERSAKVHKSANFAKLTKIYIRLDYQPPPTLMVGAIGGSADGTAIMVRNRDIKSKFLCDT